MEPTVTFTVPSDYPDYLIQILAEDILAQLPEGTHITVAREVDITFDVNQNHSAVTEAAKAMAKLCM